MHVTNLRYACVRQFAVMRVVGDPLRKRFQARCRGVCPHAKRILRPSLQQHVGEQARLDAIECLDRMKKHITVHLALFRRSPDGFDHVVSREGCRKHASPKCPKQELGQREAKESRKEAK